MADTDTTLRRNDSASRHSAIASIVYTSITKVGNSPTLSHLQS